MNKFLDLFLSGAVTGAIYSLMASGLVLTYSTSGIFNFAQAGIAFSIAYFYYQVHHAGLPVVPAALLSVFVLAPLLGLLLDRLVLRRLAKAPVYARIVGTIGLLVALPALFQWVTVAVANGTFHAGLVGNSDLDAGAPAPGLGPSPAHVYDVLHGVALSSDQIVVFIVASVCAVSLYLILRHTRFGLEIRAVVDKDTLANLRGMNVARASAIAWVMTMMLAGITGIIIAPLFTLDPNVFTLVVLSSLAAVVLAGLRSLPIAFVAGLGLGVVQNLFAGYSNFLPRAITNLNGLSSSLPYLLVLVLGLLVGRDRTRRAGTSSDDTPPADHRVGLSPLRRIGPWAIFIVVLLAYSMGWFHVSWMRADSYHQTLIAQSLAMSVIFLSFVVVTGMGGMVSLAQATFVTAGGFAAGWALNHNLGISVPLIASSGHLNFFWAMVAAAVVAGALGALIALPATRLGAVYLAIWSLAAAFFFSLVPFAASSISNGQLGWSIAPPTLSVPGLNWLNGQITRSSGPFNFGSLSDQILLFLTIFGVITLIIRFVLRSSSGRAMLATRSAEVAAQSAGIQTNRVKIMIFALSAAIAGVGGVLLSLFSLSASTSTAPPQDGLFWLAIVVLFGIRRPGGALLAGIAFVFGTALTQGLGSLIPGSVAHNLITSPYFIPILSGTGAIQLAMEPDGILAYAGLRRTAQRRARQEKSRMRTAEAEQSVHAVVSEPSPNGSLRPPASEPGDKEAILVLDRISAGYGEVEVLHEVTVKMYSGKIVALLGANGAGKSTVCSVAAGLLDPTRGSVRLRGEELTEVPPYLRARAGLFLVPAARGIFPGLTVEENLDVTLGGGADREKAYERFPVLKERRHQPAAVLSGGEQQMLSIVPALVKPPAVLIADEPTLGLSPQATAQVLDAIVELRDCGTAILLVEERARECVAMRGPISVDGTRQDRVGWSSS